MFINTLSEKIIQGISKMASQPYMQFQEQCMIVHQGVHKLHCVVVQQSSSEAAVMIDVDHALLVYQLCSDYDRL